MYRRMLNVYVYVVLKCVRVSQMGKYDALVKCVVILDIGDLDRRDLLEY